MKLTNRKNTTDWFAQAKYGLFFHYLFDIESMKSFDAEKFASQVAQTGAGYVVFTLGQNSGFYCGPNSTYEQLTNNVEGSKCFLGDVPMQAANALKQYGIRLMLYLPSHPPSADNNASKALGLDQSLDPDWNMNDETVKNWSLVIKAWSEHYAKNISGWWFDGFYPFIGMNNEYAKLYKEAVLSGNEDSIIALNQGLELTIYPANEYCDYTAGEFNEYGALPTERFVDGAQWHIASFIGSNWIASNVCVDKDFFADYINKVNAHEGVVSVGCAIYADGSMSPEQLEFMKYIKEQAHS